VLAFQVPLILIVLISIFVIGIFPPEPNKSPQSVIALFSHLPFTNNRTCEFAGEVIPTSVKSSNDPTLEPPAIALSTPVLFNLYKLPYNICKTNIYIYQT
jgi:hypothetical protein